ncbi:MAG: DoxX family protein [Dehalococcoidia bacterium]
MMTDRPAPANALNPRDIVGSGWHWTMFKLGMAIVRVGFGLVFLTNGLAKLPGFENTIPPFQGFLIDRTGARSILASDTGGHPVGIYRDLIDDVILANWGFWGPLLTATELFIGVTLILGVLTPIGALVATGFALHLNFANIHRDDKWLWEYAIEWLPLLGLALMRAGRFWGLDVWLARRFSQWPIT